MSPEDVYLTMQGVLFTLCNSVSSSNDSKYFHNTQLFSLTGTHRLKPLLAVDEQHVHRLLPMWVVNNITRMVGDQFAFSGGMKGVQVTAENCALQRRTRKGSPPRKERECVAIGMKVATARTRTILRELQFSICS